MKDLMYSKNDVMSTSLEQDAEQYFFWGPSTTTSVPDTVLLQRLMLCAPCSASSCRHQCLATTSQFRCLPRTQHFLVHQENLEDGMITFLLQLLALQLHIWNSPAWTWILHTRRSEFFREEVN